MSFSNGFSIQDLYDSAGLSRLDAAFLMFLAECDRALAERLIAARATPQALAAREESELLIAVAPHMEDFMARLFGIEAEVGALAARHHELAPLYGCKRQFVQRKAMHQYKADEALTFDGAALEQKLAARCGGIFSELEFARHVTAWQQDEAAHAEDLELALRYAAWAAHTPAGRERHRKGVLFKAPAKLDPFHLVPVVEETADGFGRYTLDESHLRRRDGFGLTDPGTDLTGALDQANYCIWCHEQSKDSCSKGLKDRKAAADSGAAAYKKSALGITLAGCPLEERISEFHKLKSAGVAVGALAMIVVDNPMVAGTGHRICNDCMKACIYQKQEPVDIPQAETRTLKDVLELPWGFELYSLLTRWNPLNLRTPFPRQASGKRVLVAGMGPAGYTLAHYLMNAGHTVVGVDGLKIEPLPAELSGVTPGGERVAFQPIRDVAELYERLDDRIMAGFGGVAEYGITV
ncbi:MAG: pyridine nucleotide-disulfide oxidoreductase, partial [Steroidobacteraceae bacterium]